MLYTARPLERVYAIPELFDQSRKEKLPQQAGEAEYKEIVLPNGRIITRREGEGYIIERVNSTDMKDYLKAEYSPGQSYVQD